ncbi:hypothetical protein ACFO6W_18540 [Dysgonomonas termitidis]|uniref:Uncharacterized protein n=1 Tax=Dysgonomonas termitidis TaxID=1516126 RepID=A0ABV9L1L4_9BACT
MERFVRFLGSWVSGGGTSEEDCMSQVMYWGLTGQGTSVGNMSRKSW